MIDPDLAADRLAKLDALGPRPPWWRFRARRRFDRSVRAIAAMDVSVSAGILRDIYNVEAVREAAERPNPMYAFLRKDAQIVGLDHVTPITYASPHALDHEGIEEAKRLITRAVNGRGEGMTWSPREPDRVTTCTPLDTRGPKRLWNETRPWVQRSSGDVGRLVTHSYLCPVHGRFEVQVPSSDVPDVVPCPLMSWSIAGFAGEHATREIAEAACRASGIGLDEVRLETQRCADDAPWSPSAVATWKSSGEISG